MPRSPTARVDLRATTGVAGHRHPEVEEIKSRPPTAPPGQSPPPPPPARGDPRRPRRPTAWIDLLMTVDVPVRRRLDHSPPPPRGRRRSRRSPSCPPPTSTQGGSGDNDVVVKQLLKAAAERDLNVTKKWAKKLAEVGVDAAVAAVEDPDFKHRGPLHLAAAVGDVGICRMLIKTFKCNVNATDDGGGTPLIFALYGNGTLYTVRILVNNGADVNKSENSGITPLHITAERELCAVAQLLLAKGAIVDPVCKDGETPLHFAARFGNAKMRKLLLEHNANFNRLSKKSTTPLLASLSCASLDCLKILIEAGADVNAHGSVNPLVKAARNGLTDCIKCLLQAGANANIADDKEWTVDGIMEYERTELLCRLTAEEEGDAAFLKADYVTAVTSYTYAMELDLDSRLYAKRSLCYLRLSDEKNALADAIAFKDTQHIPDSSSDPLILVKDYGKEWEMSCFNSGSGSGLTGDSIESI